mgnify:CR=1 FL=1
MRISELYKDRFEGDSVSVSGWIRTLRCSKSFGFIELNDGSSFKNLQIVIEEDKLENYSEVSKLSVGSSGSGYSQIFFGTWVYICQYSYHNRKRLRRRRRDVQTDCGRPKQC